MRGGILIGSESASALLLSTALLVLNELLYVILAPVLSVTLILTRVLLYFAQVLRNTVSIF